MKAILRKKIFKNKKDAIFLKLNISSSLNGYIFETFLILLVVAIHFLPQGKIARQDPGTT